MTDKSPFEWTIVPGDPDEIAAAKMAPPEVEDHIWFLVEEGVTTPDADALMDRVMPEWRERWALIVSVNAD